MAVTGIGGTSALSLQSIADMRNQLDDLQRQLGTGKKSDSYAGLGLDRGLTVGLRSQLIRHLGLPVHHHPGRSAARSDADRADAVRQRVAAEPRARSCNRSTRCTAAPRRRIRSTSKARSIRCSACSTPRPTAATCFPAAPSIRRRSRPPITSSMATDSRPASSRSSTSAGRPISAPAASAGWSIGAPTATSVSVDRGCGVAVRLQACRHHHRISPAPR